MDYMNLHQSAHGGREFGHIVSRMRINRHVIAGHWQEDDVQKEFGDWPVSPSDVPRRRA